MRDMEAAAIVAFFILGTVMLARLAMEEGREYTIMYAVPLASITEIVKPEVSSRHSIRDQQVMTLRETVLPLMDMRPRLQEAGPEPEDRFAVVVGVGKDRVGLIVDHLIGQEEVVIKPLDDEFTSGGPFSGATIREDGSVSLIIDVIQLIRDSQSLERKAA